MDEADSVADGIDLTDVAAARAARLWAAAAAAARICFSTAYSRQSVCKYTNHSRVPRGVLRIYVGLALRISDGHLTN